MCNLLQWRPPTYKMVLVFDLRALSLHHHHRHHYTIGMISGDECLIPSTKDLNNDLLVAIMAIVRED